jgi:hypothetical protein
MKSSLATIAATGFLAATVTAYSAPAEDAAQNKPPQPAAEGARSNMPGGVLQVPNAAPNRVNPSRETTGAAAPGAPRDPVPAGGKHDDEDQSAPKAIPAPR